MILCRMIHRANPLIAVRGYYFKIYFKYHNDTLYKNSYLDFKVYLKIIIFELLTFFCTT